MRFGKLFFGVFFLFLIGIASAFILNVDVTVVGFSDGVATIILPTDGIDPLGLFNCDGNTGHRCLITPDGLTLDYDYCITDIGYPTEICIEGKAVIDDYNKNLLAAQLVQARADKVAVEKETVPELTKAFNDLSRSFTLFQLGNEDTAGQVLWGLGIVALVWGIAWVNEKRKANKMIVPTPTQELGVELPETRRERNTTELPPIPKHDDSTEFLDEMNEFVEAKEKVEAKKVKKIKPIVLAKEKLEDFKAMAEKAIKKVKKKKEVAGDELLKDAT